MSHKFKWLARMRDLADYWSQYSTCKRRKVGAVLFDPTSFQVLTFGYNDTPTGEMNCGDGGCSVCNGEIPTRDNLDCFCVHAEMNCINFAARWGIKVQGMHLVSTIPPCRGCRKNLLQAGVIWIS